MQNILDSGVLLVAAAGNSGDGTHSYPASYDAVMSVAAVDETGLHAEFSQYTNQVEVSGPGEAILSTVGIGDGRQGYLSWGSNNAGDDRVLPHTRYASSGGSYVQSNIDGSASGELAACTTSASSFSCGNMSGKVCVVERAENQSGSNYPEIDAARACADAGAEAAVIYSNSERPGLQNPFLVDDSNGVTIPTVSVNRTLGQQLASASGTMANINVQSGTDYAYYNGTSMASPHVAGVAALVWSLNPSCSANDVRSALTATALDLDVAGRDDRTGYGLVQAKDAADYLAANCDTGGGDPAPNVLANGQTVSNLSASQGDSLSYTMEMPAGASDLSFVMTGGSGDADLYVKFGSEPTSGDYDCRPYKNGNEEQCDFSTPQQGTWYVNILGYTAFSGVSLTGTYTEGSTGGGSEGGSASESDLSASSGQWLYYTVEIPAGMSNLTVDISGGSGDADLYVRQGAQPTTSNYDCRPYEYGNDETCSFDNPAASTWHIGIRAYSSFSGLTLNAQWQP